MPELEAPSPEVEYVHKSLPSQPTLFQRAIEEYLKGLPEKKRKRKFIVDCQRSTNGSITPEAIHDSIKKAEEKTSKQRSIRNALEPVVRVLKDYDCIIGTLGRFFSCSRNLPLLICSIGR
jgi:hypothetical protein